MLFQSQRICVRFKKINTTCYIIKESNLEKVRTDIVGTISNSEDMTSQALTKVLMDDVDDDDTIESSWHGSMDKTEIEASVYCEVNDWLKSKEGAGFDERYVCMV